VQILKEKISGVCVFGSCVVDSDICLW